MKIYISVDIEGVSGVVNRSHTSESGHNYERARKLMTNEANAAIKGALAAGAKEIIVNDSHGPMTNLLLEDLNPEAKLISGAPKRLSMMEGIDSTFDGVIFVGYHARMNTLGVLSHTYDSRVISNININGISVGEFGLNALLAGSFGVPVLAVTGDDVLHREVKAFNDTIETVIVKTACGIHAAKCLNPYAVNELIEESVTKAIKNKSEIKLCKVSDEIELEITFMNSAMAEIASVMPGSQRTAPNKVIFRTTSMLEAFKARIALTNIASEVL